MISKLILSLQNTGERKLDYQASSSLQGVLMQFVDPLYGDFLHQSQQHPYSQSVQVKQDRLVWCVTALNREAAEGILIPLIEKAGNSIYIKHHDQSLKILGRGYGAISYDTLMQQYYLQDQPRYLSLRFVTPTAFKQAGHYCIMPDVRLIFQNLMMRYDTCVTDSKIFDEEVLAHLAEHSRIVRYHLKSTSFPLEGIRIPSFTGTITLKIDGPQQMVNLAWLLAAFGTYAGVGIKTSMGMGAIKIIERGGRQHE